MSETTASAAPTAPPFADHSPDNEPPQLPYERELLLVERLYYELRQVIIGQTEPLEQLLACVLAGGHVLLEGVPGLAKTLAARSLASTVGGSFNRIQFTPDLVPSDICGTRIFRASDGDFVTELGPVFCNVLVADEINRAPAKVQSALLEVMGESQVTIAGVTHPVPQPFIVVATQNPIESEGVYPLPEAQRDRFLMKIELGFPDHRDEVEIVSRRTDRTVELKQILTPTHLAHLQEMSQQVFVDRGVVDYAVRLVGATRDPAAHGIDELVPYIAAGAGPRGSLALIDCARAFALMAGRHYATSEDVRRSVLPVLRHRIALGFEARSAGVKVDDVIFRIVENTPDPTHSFSEER